jgi:hypothetical protein
LWWYGAKLHSTYARHDLPEHRGHSDYSIAPNLASQMLLDRMWYSRCLTSGNRGLTADVLAQNAAERSFAGRCRNDQRTTDEAVLKLNRIRFVWILVHLTSFGLLTIQVGGVEVRMETSRWG